MELLRFGLTTLWIMVTLLFSGFVLWRKLKRERVDFEDMVIDRSLLALGAGVLGGRLAFVLLHLDTFGWSIGKWLSLGSFPGVIDVVALAVGLLVFWLSLGKEWKDAVEVIDYASIGLAFFLFLLSLGDGLLEIVNAFLLALGGGSAAAVPAFDTKTLFWSLVLSGLYLALFAFLSHIEREYRTFLWYRAKRRSAQTGFVIASFLIGYGLIWVSLGWLVPASIVVAGIRLDLFFKLLVMIMGIVILYVRSGKRP